VLPPDTPDEQPNEWPDDLPIPADVIEAVNAIRRDLALDEQREREEVPTR
jgi:hypothetical protein